MYLWIWCIIIIIIEVNVYRQYALLNINVIKFNKIRFETKTNHMVSFKVLFDLFITKICYAYMFLYKYDNYVGRLYDTTLKIIYAIWDDFQWMSSLMFSHTFKFIFLTYITSGIYVRISFIDVVWNINLFQFF